MVTQINVRRCILVALFAALTAAGAFLKIPLPNVPVTLQTLVVILSGSLLGPQLGLLSQIVYLSIGLIGFPVFAQGGGPGYVLQPTFGYLLSYPLVAYLAGYLSCGIGTKKLPRPYLFIVLLQTASLIPMFIIGTMYLYFSLHYIMNTPLTVRQVIWSGCLIFLPIEVVKMFISGYITIRLRKLLFIS
jgi:biotin transport system substrate-specific component